MPEPIDAIEAVQTVASEEEGKWTGIDVSIVGKYAKKYGRPPRDPYINTDQGDLLLFVFTFFGLVGGIIIGYNFRKLFVEGKDQGLHRSSDKRRRGQEDAEIAKKKLEKKIS
ncbi:hypothetical protein SCALIN_C27_0006 [Candidatus Scalindua japonica]|uniref:Uncharacterized protein n=1 Tax=Candidatus Scalindua japonica TaxID=1284222 RepID=A0A286U0F4_9BACT|nr:hypothetical protein [Candidatus Scalindua japonica]GAX61612.1 hypothetical protein SCALIN_C27_0006 [Candidatus Scalindua japonica]